MPEVEETCIYGKPVTPSTNQYSVIMHSDQGAGRCCYIIRTDQVSASRTGGQIKWHNKNIEPTDWPSNEVNMKPTWEFKSELKARAGGRTAIDVWLISSVRIIRDNCRNACGADYVIVGVMWLPAVSLTGSADSVHICSQRTLCPLNHTEWRTFTSKAIKVGKQVWMLNHCCCVVQVWLVGFRN